MRSNEERINCLHERAREIRKKRERTILRMYGCLCMGLSFFLLGMFRYYCGISLSYTEGSFTGASLLSESAGGYVLIAVIAFMVGAALAVYFNRKHHRKKREDEER